MEKKFEVECQRTNVTPKAFFKYCAKRAKEKGIDVESYTEYDNWIDPELPQAYTTHKHEDWEKPQMEILKYQPYDIELYLQNTYNFIMEFEFDTETRGHGYMYVVEYVI